MLNGFQPSPAVYDAEKQNIFQRVLRAVDWCANRHWKWLFLNVF